MLSQQPQQIPAPKIIYRPTPKQHEAWLALEDPTINEEVFGGGAGGGKSVFGCAWIIINAQRYPASRWFIGRKELKRLKQSVLLTFFELLGQWGFMPRYHYTYNATESKITFANRTEVYLIDMDKMPSDPNYERFGSVEYTGGFIEEAAEVEAKAKEVLYSRIRYKLTEFNLVPKLLMTCNPSKNWLYQEYYKPWKEGTLPRNRAFIRSLVTDNLHISPHYIESLRGLKDRVLKERLLNGNWEYDDNDNALFIYDRLLDMFSNKLKENIDFKCLICDAARFGKDKAVIYRFEGWRLVEKREFDKSATTLIEETLLMMAQTHSIPISQVLVDEDGVGGGIVDHLKCKGFVGGAAPFDRRKESEKKAVEYKINYKNLRAQCYHKLAEVVNEYKVEIAVTGEPEFQEKLIEELEHIKVVDFDSDSKFKIIPKDEIKLSIGRSPDYADTLMMRCWFEVNPLREPPRIFSHNPFN